MTITHKVTNSLGPILKKLGSQYSIFGKSKDTLRLLWLMMIRWGGLFCRTSFTWNSLLYMIETWYHLFTQYWLDGWWCSNFYHCLHPAVASTSAVDFKSYLIQLFGIPAHLTGSDDVSLPVVCNTLDEMVAKGTRTIRCSTWTDLIEVLILKLSLLMAFSQSS